MKVNILLKKLPKLKANISAQDAFAGTFHINQSYSQMETSFQEALQGKFPTHLPCRNLLSCTLTDPSILSNQMVAEGFHTLTLFGFDVPYRQISKQTTRNKKNNSKKAYLQAISQYLEEPIETALPVLQMVRFV